MRSKRVRRGQDEVKKGQEGVRMRSRRLKRVSGGGQEGVRGTPCIIC